jgi:hypothetical protein
MKNAEEELLELVAKPDLVLRIDATQRRALKIVRQLSVEIPELKELAKTLKSAMRAAESGKGIGAVRNALGLIAEAIPKIRRAHAARAEALAFMESEGVDMEERARILDARKKDLLFKNTSIPLLRGFSEEEAQEIFEHMKTCAGCIFCL